MVAVLVGWSPATVSAETPVLAVLRASCPEATVEVLGTDETPLIAVVDLDPEEAEVLVAALGALPGVVVELDRTVGALEERP